MKRIFYKAEESCRKGCMYCFAKSKSYLNTTSFPVLTENSYELNHKATVYPCCDGEILENKNLAIKILSKIAENNCIISISTKSNISEEVLDYIARINTKMIEEGRGFVKISISFSCLSLIETIEPGCNSFKERVNLLKLINEQHIPSSVIFKPILPFTSIEEWREIIEKTSIYSNRFLLGGLYVFEDSTFYNKYIKGKYSLNKKIVNWMPGKTEWLYTDSLYLKRSIKKIIMEKNCKPFNCDAELIEDICIENNINHEVTYAIGG